MFKDLFPLNLQFFAEDTGAGEGEGGEGAEGQKGQPSDGTKKTETKTEGQKHEEHMIPKSRFDEVNNNFKSVKEELESLKTEREKAAAERQKKEQEDAEKRGEFENLYKKSQETLEQVKAERKTASERIESLEGVINGLLETKLKNIDEEYHDLIPDGTPEQKLAWVTSAEEKGIFGNKPSSQPLGEKTNPKEHQEVDINTLSPIELLKAGYANKK